MGRGGWLAVNLCSGIGIEGKEVEKRFRKVAVLMGGPSAERDVSLHSGEAVVRGLREAGYDAVSVDVAGRQVDLPAGCEAVFIALHGEFGEDGEIQEILDRRGVPYTGSGARASRDAMDKLVTKNVLTGAGIPTAAFEVLTNGAEPMLSLPVVVKPLRQGSSLGVSKVSESSQWLPALEEARRYGSEVLVETFVDGLELTVGIVDRETLPVIQIDAPEGAYTYGAKYTKGVTEYRVPAPIDADMEHRCRSCALRTFDALGCRGFGRVDLRSDARGAVYVLECNTIPGFTETSLLPKAAARAGMAFPALCDRILNLARCGA